MSATFRQQFKEIVVKFSTFIIQELRAGRVSKDMQDWGRIVPTLDEGRIQSWICCHLCELFKVSVRTISVHSSVAPPGD